jgi:uncharacterized protein (DUF1330 family)
MGDGEDEMKAYSIAVIDVKDQDGYMREYVPKATKLIEAASGKVLVRGGKTAGESPPTGRVVVVAYDSLAKVEALVASAEWLELSEIGAKYATVNAYAVEGVD